MARFVALTFARGAQAWSPQFLRNQDPDPSFTFNDAYAAVGSDKWFSWTGPLPDIVLAPLSTIQFNVGYGGGPNPAFTVGPTVVTLTQEQVASSVEIPVGPFMLVPGPES